MLKKILSFIATLLVILNIVLFSFRQISITIFWLVIVFCAVIAYLVKKLNNF